MRRIFAITGIRGRLYLLLVIVFIPIFLIESFIFYRWYETRKSEQLQANLEIARAVAKNFETFIQDLIRSELVVGLALTSSQPISDRDRNRILDGFQADHPAVRGIFWMNPEGAVIASSLRSYIGFNLSDRSYFQRVKEGQKWVASELILGRATNKPAFTVSHGIWDDKGKLLGVVAASIEPDRLDSVLGIARSGKDAGISLIDNRGWVVYRHPAIEFPSWEERNWTKYFPMIRDSLKGKEVLANITQSKTTGNRRLAALVPVSFIGWVATAGRDEDQVIKAVISSLLFQAGLLFFVTLAGFGAAVVLARPISNAVIGLRNRALAIGRGEKVDVTPASGPEEFKDLGAVFDQMAEDVRSREAALRESEQRWATTLASVGDAVIATNLSGKITFMNKIAEEMTGWILAEATSKPVADVFHIINEHTRKRVEDPVAKVLKEGVIVGLANHTVLVGKSGIEIPIDDSGAPIRDQDGRLLGVVLVFRDITERKRAEKVLRASEARLRRFYESGLLGVMYWNMNGEITDANDKFLEMVGYTREELSAGQIDWVHMTPPEYRQRDEESVAELKATGVNKVPFEKEYLRKDGTRVPIIVAGAMLDEALFNGVAFVLDITIRKQAMEALRESEARYRSLFEHMLEGFAYCQMLFDEHGRPEDFVYLDVNNAFGRLTGLKDVIGKRVTQVIPQIKELTPELFEIYGRVALTGNPERFEIDFKPLGLYLSVSVYSPAKGYFVAVFDDITERTRADRERETTVEFLRLVNESTTTRELIKKAVSFFKSQSGCEAVGVRLRDGNDYPYFEVHGFPQEFVQAENSLCARDSTGEIVRDASGNPLIECMCGNIICGRFDVSKPFFSPGGSFWTNSTTELLASTTEAERQARTRNRCNGEGYESVALIPLQSGEGRIGLLQLNDRRRGQFTSEVIALWERLGGYFAVALAKTRAEEALRESEIRLTADLKAMTRLQKLGTLFVGEGNLEPVLGEIVDAAIAISGADFGNIQLLDHESSDLKIAVQHGFPEWWVDFWNSVSKGRGACGTALSRGERVIVEDVEQNPIFIGTPALEIQRKAGVRAVQSTPLVNRSGKPVGMFSTHYKVQHRPDDSALRLLDILARQAADIIEHAQTGEALKKRTLELQHLTETLEDRVKERTAELASLSTQLVSAQENERKRVSYDLHDNVWQMLVTIRFEIENLFSGQDDWSSLQTKSKKVMATVLDTVGKIRSMQGDLWPYVLDDIGALATIDWYCREFEKNSPGLIIEKTNSITETEIPPTAKIVIYRILQETLNNIVRHSRANRIALRLIKRDHGMEFTVEDNGVGFDPEETISRRTPWGGLGLLSIKARTELSGGSFTIESSKGKGTIVRASWPL